MRRCGALVQVNALRRAARKAGRDGGRVGAADGGGARKHARRPDDGRFVLRQLERVEAVLGGRLTVVGRPETVGQTHVTELSPADVADRLRAALREAVDALQYSPTTQRRFGLRGDGA